MGPSGLTSLVLWALILKSLYRFCIATHPRHVRGPLQHLQHPERIEHDKVHGENNAQAASVGCTIGSKNVDSILSGTVR